MITAREVYLFLISELAEENKKLDIEREQFRLQGEHLQAEKMAIVRENARLSQENAGLVKQLVERANQRTRKTPR